MFGQRTLIAARLQQSLLPERLPAVPGVEVAVRYATAEEAVDVGGDFYDLVAISPREHVVVVGDVSGRGVDAATVTGLARHTLRAVAHELSPARALARLGDVLHAQEAGERFVTAVVARLERTGPTALEVTLARGGHTYPVLVRASGEVSVLRSEGQLLGAFPGAVPQELVELLGPGDALVLYTDGITESRGHDELFGEERLAAVAAAHAGAGAEETGGRRPRGRRCLQDGARRGRRRAARAALRGRRRAAARSSVRVGSAPGRRVTARAFTRNRTSRPPRGGFDI